MAWQPLFQWGRLHEIHSQITKFMGPTWGPPGSCRPQKGPMSAPWTLLSGLLYFLMGILIFQGLLLSTWRRIHKVKFEVHDFGLYIVSSWWYDHTCSDTWRQINVFLLYSRVWYCIMFSMARPQMLPANIAFANDVNVSCDLYLAILWLTEKITKKINVRRINRCYCSNSYDSMYTRVTHWGPDKMTAIMLTTFSNSFFGMKIYVVWFKLHWKLFPRPQLTIR